jgi:hypothetical protein
MRDGKKYRIVNLILDIDDNPAAWTEEEYKIITDNEVVIGYFMKLDGEQMKMNVYLIPEKYCKGYIVTKNDLKLAYAQWLVNMRYNQNKKLVQFHNPPIENWLDTKEQWIKKTAHKLSKTFDKPYDEMLSHVHYAIVKAFSKDGVYVGNLGYIERSAYNEVLMDIRNNRNKLIIDNTEKVSSLDEQFEIDGTTHTLNEIYGEEDQGIAEMDFNETTEEIKKVLSYTFSDREIDQIINSQGQLPLNLYRRLLNWRKEHKRGDFNVK